jgi:hypothetical protein
MTIVMELDKNGDTSSEAAFTLASWLRLRSGNGSQNAASMIVALAAERDALRAALAEKDRLLAEAAGALEPFAGAASEADKRWLAYQRPGTELQPDGTTVGLGTKLGDFRRARAVLAKLNQAEAAKPQGGAT